MSSVTTPRVPTFSTWLREQIGVDASGGMSTVDWLVTPRQRFLGVASGAVHADDSGLLGCTSTLGVNAYGCGRVGERACSGTSRRRPHHPSQRRVELREVDSCRSGRERDRGDRRIGEGRTHVTVDRIHTFGPYDLDVDTTSGITPAVTRTVLGAWHARGPLRALRVPDS